jgi:hypothetical protein
MPIPFSQPLLFLFLALALAVLAFAVWRHLATR